MKLNAGGKGKNCEDAHEWLVRPPRLVYGITYLCEASRIRSLIFLGISRGLRRITSICISESDIIEAGGRKREHEGVTAVLMRPGASPLRKAVDGTHHSRTMAGLPPGKAKSCGRGALSLARFRLQYSGFCVLTLALGLAELRPWSYIGSFP